jgi:asparagine synthase (glutamine-hydrolysing)
MCGLVAIVRTDAGPVDASILGAMTDALQHRGPDDSGTYISGSVGIGFRRLSILDLSPTGHQPMTSEDGTCVIAFNGEIYNFCELRVELQTLGYRFCSTGDTEVLLNAYRAWGMDCLERLNGMWAFVVHDRRRNVLFGSRDRFGIKPLYHCRTESADLFASEIKAFRASGLYRPRTNWRTAAAFLLEQRLDEDLETLYDDVRQIPAGSAFEVPLLGRMRDRRFWQLSPREHPINGNVAGEFADLFEDAIRIHMRSDVPVGVHLSGGLDSTSIACASARVRRNQSADGDLMTFSYMPDEFAEAPYIEATVAQTGAQLFQLTTSPEALWASLGRVLWFQDEPVHSFTALVGYQLMGLAREQGVKVILNGQGADETLGGYPSYFAAYWQSLLGARRYGLAWHEMRVFADASPGRTLALFAAQAKRRLQFGLRHHASYTRLSLARRAAKLRNNDWFDGELVRNLPEPAPGTANDLEEVLVDSVVRAPLPLYLRVEDRNSMAHSIECRVPFLDHRLVEFAFTLPPDWHMRGRFNKFMLREAMRGRIPEVVRTRVDKMGFPTPSNRWLAGVLHESLCSVLLDRETRERGLFNVRALERDLRRQAAGEVDLSDRLFDAAQFELSLRLAERTSPP